MFLIQIGGLGIMTAGAFVFLILKKVGVKAGAGLKIVLEEDYISGVKRATRFIIVSTILIELIGAILIFFQWNKMSLMGTGKLAFSSLFHSVSAFCNAGFSLFQDNLMKFKGDVLTNVIISSLIILGGIGFLVMEDVYRNFRSFIDKPRIHMVPNFHVHKKIRLSLHSKIVLIATLLVILIGAFLFYFFEKENLSGLSQKEMVLSSFFQIITSRTAGFNTVDIGVLTLPTLVLLMFVMFVGAAPTSTAGGIKVTSLAIIVLAITSFLKGDKDIVVFGRTLPRIQMKSVFILVASYLAFCLVIFFLMLYTEKGIFEKILFEIFSAMGTVGLSTGITAQLTGLGKSLIILTMFVGRLLPLSIAVLGSRKLIEPVIIMPEEKVILG
jgi:trk system potassium uptake protein TrkH